MKNSSRIKHVSKIILTGFSILLLVALMRPAVTYAFPCDYQDKTGTYYPEGCNPDENQSGANNTNQQSGANNNGQQSGANNTNTKQSGANNTGGVNINTGIKNPLGDNYDTIPKFIEAIINFVLLIGVPIVTLAIIYSGFLFVTAQGNSEKLKVAKKTLMYTLIGAALLLGALTISKAIEGTVKEIDTNANQTK